MKKIVIATKNAGKVREMKDAFAHLPVEVVALSDFGQLPNAIEDGETFAENAAIKAKFYMEKTGCACLADDSGLEVDCLNGEPGIYSARYCPKPGADDADRRHYLLENIQKCGAERPWTARFRCEIAIVFPGENRTLRASGACEGEIIPEERGSNGFGYDPVFYKPELGRTLAELSEAEKNAISHRGNAIKKAKPFLMSIER